MLTVQQLNFQEQLSQFRSEQQQREFEILMELAQARAQAAAHQAALEQQTLAQHQQQELVSQIVKLSGGQSIAKPAQQPHLQSRIEQLTIENVQLRHTIEELREQIKQIARQPATHR